MFSQFAGGYCVQLVWSLMTCRVGVSAPLLVERTTRMGIGITNPASKWPGTLVEHYTEAIVPTPSVHHGITEVIDTIYIIKNRAFIAKLVVQSPVEHVTR